MNLRSVFARLLGRAGRPPSRAERRRRQRADRRGDDRRIRYVEGGGLGAGAAIAASHDLERDSDTHPGEGEETLAATAAGLAAEMVAGTVVEEAAATAPAADAARNRFAQLPPASDSRDVCATGGFGAP